MIRIAVVDDVCEVCTQLEKYLLQLSDKYNQEIEVEPFYSGKSICDALKKHDSYDLILLVYISANSQYSLQLHQMHPLDFLIKEIQFSDVDEIFKRFLKLQKKWSDVFEYKYGHDSMMVKVKNIRYLKVENRMITIFLKGSDNLPFSENAEHKGQYYGTLQEAYEKQLKQHGFLYLHKAYLVNSEYIATYEYHQVILTDHTIIPIGSSKRKEIRLLQMQMCDKIEKGDI